jgi:hypothetical protein
MLAASIKAIMLINIESRKSIFYFKNNKICKKWCLQITEFSNYELMLVDHIAGGKVK